MTVYFWYYWYKLVDLKKEIDKKISVKVEQIKYQRYLKKCHKHINKNYLPTVKKLMELPFFDRLDTSGPVIIANNEEIVSVISKFKTAGKALVIPDDVYEFIKDNIVGFDKEQLEAEPEEVLNESKNYGKK